MREAYRIYHPIIAVSLLVFFCAVSIMTVVVPLSAFLRLISRLRLSVLIAFLSFTEMLSFCGLKTI